MAKRFVLLHGAWHGGWCWDGVVDLLEGMGHTCAAPTMPGHGPDDDRSTITYNDYSRALADALQAQPEPVILVGHSSAGHMIQAGAPLAADRLERIVFHNAFILPDGKSQFDLVPPEVAQGMTAAAAASPDNTVPVDEGFIRGVLMADAPAQVQDSLISRLIPQPLALFTTPIDAGPFNALDVPKSVLFCQDDVSLPPGAYLGMAQGLGEHRLVEIPGGHETLYTDPRAFVDGLMRAID